MRILITGGLGFVGTNLVTSLVDRPGLELRILDNGQAGAPKTPLQNIRLDIRYGDVRDQAAVEKSVLGVDAVVHLAAATGVEDSIHRPRESLQVNIEGTLNLLEAARRHGVRRFIYASSNAAVGPYCGPIDESVVPVPGSPYGAGKLAGEALCAAYSATFGIDTVALRFSNVYGPYSEHKESVVASFFRSAIDGGPLTVYGDGVQTRDFLFIDDLCRATWLAIERGQKRLVVQIASGVETQIGVLAQKISALVEEDLGVTIPILYKPPRSGDVPRSFSSIALAREKLGYLPQVSLDEGLRRTWSWFKTHGTSFIVHSGVNQDGAE